MRRIVCLLVIAFALTACGKRAAWNSSVVGPDLDASGPFDAAHSVVLTGPARGGGRDMRITITRRDGQDHARLENVISDSKDYMAGVTWRKLAPDVADSRDNDYWIVATNATRTLDRSTYAVLRVPRGVDIHPGVTSTDFSYAVLDCGDLDMARRDSYAATDADGKAVGTPIPLTPAPPPEAGDCEYNSRTEALAVTPVVLRSYDLVRDAADAPKLDWRPLRVEVR